MHGTELFTWCWKVRGEEERDRRDEEVEGNGEEGEK